MNQIILSGIQITISIWEMWMCYEILYMTVLDKKYADKKETIIRWANIFVVGSLLGINRLIAFFSRTMLGLVVILTIMCMYGIKRKKVVLSAGIVFVYFEFIAILDFILAFISMEFIKEQFEHVIYIYALTWQKVLIYFFTRGISLLGIVNIKKREESIRSMIEQCCGIIVITGALLCAVLFKYQLWLDEMANGSKPIRGINASMNLSAISLLIVLSGMFIIKYQGGKREKTTLILRDQLLEERYAEMLKSRQMIHDMKNHLLVLRNMERANQWDKLHDYLEEISKDILDDSTKIWTGNNIVDLILNSKKKQAECRLKGAYLIRCTGCVKDENGSVTEVLAEYDPESRGGDPADGRKVRGATIHWVDAATAIDAEVRLYDNLFTDADPDAADKNFLECLNPNSLEVLTGCKVEPSLADAAAPASFQFMRLGYFCLDSKDSKPGHLVFNRSVSLKDSFKK